MKFLFNNITGQSIPIRNKPKPKNENKFFSSGIFDVNNFKRDTQTILEKTEDIPKNINQYRVFRKLHQTVASPVNPDLKQAILGSDELRISSPEKIQVNINKNINKSDEIFCNISKPSVSSEVLHHGKALLGSSGNIPQSITIRQDKNDSHYLSEKAIQQPNRVYSKLSQSSVSPVVSHQGTSEKNFINSPKDNFDNEINNLYKFTKIKAPLQVKIEKSSDKEKEIFSLKEQIVSQKENLFKNFQEIDDIFKNKKECINHGNNLVYLPNKVFEFKKDNEISHEQQQQQQSLPIFTGISNTTAGPRRACSDADPLESGATKERMITLNNYSDSIQSSSIKNITYGIKKTTNSDINFLNKSMNCNYFKIGLNSGTFYKTVCSDCLYLFPYISEINKEDINSIHEKKIESFRNKNNIHDIQYFPLDYIPCGNIIPLLMTRHQQGVNNQIRIFNIYWNIIQSINNNEYKNNEILCFVPNISEYNLKNIKLQINFEIHNQISGIIEEKFINSILPYKNHNITNLNPANTCLTKVISVIIDKVNGNLENDIIIDLPEGLDLNSVLLCAKISIPNESFHVLNGYDKNNILNHGYVPFSQFLLQFDYGGTQESFLGCGPAGLTEGCRRDEGADDSV
jgi:hypothetical protein